MTETPECCLQTWLCHAFVRSGRQFSPTGQPENALRLGFASLNQEEIRQATLRLAQAVNAL
ncbi:MAG: hypothetical protein EOP06_29485 [Proteobacteria bacterium]|nr:MAG: hypothetical protein EOP06_29485 [Pseudomonadota bacterium]